VGGEHLDRDAAGCSDESLGREFNMYYFLPEGKDLAAVAGLPSEGGEEVDASVPAPAAGAPAESARSAAEPADQGAATNPTEMHGAAAEAVG